MKKTTWHNEEPNKHKYHEKYAVVFDHMLTPESIAAKMAEVQAHNTELLFENKMTPKDYLTATRIMLDREMMAFSNTFVRELCKN